MCISSKYNPKTVAVKKMKELNMDTKVLSDSSAFAFDRPITGLLLCTWNKLAFLCPSLTFRTALTPSPARREGLRVRRSSPSPAQTSASAASSDSEVLDESCL